MDQELQEVMRGQIDELKSKKIDCFKMCFRVKVADAIDFLTTGNVPPRSKQVIISFVMTNPEMYEEI
jgi:hypothetical protein